MPDTRDELAAIIAREIRPFVPDANWSVDRVAVVAAETATRAILASGVLANLRADAWDEGSEAMFLPNPYRKSASDDVSR